MSTELVFLGAPAWRTGGARHVLDVHEGIDAPAYTPTAAARFLLLPVSTVRWWTLGTGAHPPVIRIAEADEHLLSFRNLVEVHVLSAVMRHDRSRAPIAIIRTVVGMLAEVFRSAHPLADARMRDEGKEYVATRLAALIDATKHEQNAIAATLATYLDRVRRDRRGDPARLLLFTRGRPEGPEHVMMDPHVQSGEPCLAATEIRTATVAWRFRSGASVRELATAYARSEAEIEEAIRYEAEIR